MGEGNPREEPNPANNGFFTANAVGKKVCHRELLEGQSCRINNLHGGTAHVLVVVPSNRCQSSQMVRAGRHLVDGQEKNLGTGRYRLRRLDSSSTIRLWRVAAIFPALLSRGKGLRQGCGRTKGIGSGLKYLAII
ncbi:hypothetical protein TcasGA2_TC011387 [Tribolium castaneum]|uniref:Uncharacterized protein n=1 Tax=Tribolium castaneum TaxID=7070 RepID=D6X4D5_TRICA|nr:hypothetical protein TcasGA2_TC011387 [Tribolium castaneum]